MNMLDTIVARDLADDVRRARTFPGGYTPTPRVLVQRDWHAEHDRACDLARSFDAIDDPTWSEWEGGGSFCIGFRDNRDAERLDARIRALCDALVAAGFRAKLSHYQGRAHLVHVKHDLRRETEIRRVAPFYLARLSDALRVQP